MDKTSLFFEQTALESALPRLCHALLKASATPLILALDGDLGAGKTTLTRHFAQALGLQARVTSPSFVLMNVYRHPQEADAQAGLIHADFYRLDDASAESVVAELEEHGAQHPMWVWVEWASRIPSFAQMVDLQLDITVAEEARRYRFTGVSEQGLQAVMALREALT